MPWEGFPVQPPRPSLLMIRLQSYTVTSSFKTSVPGLIWSPQNCSPSSRSTANILTVTTGGKRKWHCWWLTLVFLCLKRAVDRGWGHKATLSRASTLYLHRFVLWCPRKVVLKRVRGYAQANELATKRLIHFLIEVLLSYKFQNEYLHFQLLAKMSIKPSILSHLTLITPALCPITQGLPAPPRARSRTWKETPRSGSATELNQSTQWKGWWQVHIPTAKVILRETCNF